MKYTHTLPRHRCFFAALQLEGFGCTLQHLTFPGRAYLFIYACIGLIAVALSPRLSVC